MEEQEMSKPKIKQLVWEGDIVLQAEALEHAWTISESLDEDGYMLEFTYYPYIMPIYDKPFETIEEAKSTAQEHFEKLVLECLE